MNFRQYYIHKSLNHCLYICNTMINVTTISTTKKLTPILTITILVGVIFLLGPGIPINAEAATMTEWLDCRPASNGQPGDPICDLQTGIALNNLVSAPPAGPLVVLEPDTFEHTSTWESAPSTAPITLLPGPVTLDLLHTNLSENSNDQDICWSKHAILPDGSEITIVQQHCFENPLPVAGSICPFGAVLGGLVAPFTPDIPAACIAAAGVASETVPSLIVAPTVLPVGTVIELNISCPGNSFLAVFFNDGIDVDGDGVLEFTTITEPVAKNDHYLGYEAKETKDSPDFIERLVRLDDQFVSGTFNVEKTKMLFNPVDKNGEGISDEFTHLKAYKIQEGQNNILVENQFGELIVDTTKAELLLVPTAKSLTDPDLPALDSTLVDHYKCYKVKIDKNAPLQFEPQQVTLFDPNFNAKKLFDVKKPKMLCNPVDKDGEGIINPENHLMCYDVKPADGFEKNKKVSVFTNNQFGNEQLDVKKEKQLCVPSTKTLLP